MARNLRVERGVVCKRVKDIEREQDDEKRVRERKRFTR